MYGLYISIGIRENISQPDASMISSFMVSLDMFGTYVAMPTNITIDCFDFPNDAARVSNKIKMNLWIKHVYSVPQKK